MRPKSQLLLKMIPFPFHPISFSKFTCKPQLAYFICSFACMTSLVSSFNHSKLRKFISLWKINQNTIKLYRRIFLYKTNKKCKKNEGWNVLYFCGYDVTYAKFKTLYFYNLLKSDQSATKLCKRHFLHKIKKICHKNRGEVLVSSSL